MNFESLVGRINQVQDVLQAQAAHAINLSLTARNWLVGYYIVEFEQKGEDRAKYGDKLINRLAESINRKGFEPRRLREYRQVYIVYPSLGVEIIKYIQKSQITISPIIDNSIWRLSSAKLQHIDNQEDKSGGWHPPNCRLQKYKNKLTTTPSITFEICVNMQRVQRDSIRALLSPLILIIFRS